ncbi:MAG: hypothetical protein ACO3JG_08040, partial [Luteolibacter sp.]
QEGTRQEGTCEEGTCEEGASQEGTCQEGCEENREESGEKRQGGQESRQENSSEKSGEEGRQEGREKIAIRPGKTQLEPKLARPSGRPSRFRQSIETSAGDLRITRRFYVSRKGSRTHGGHSPMTISQPGSFS